MSHGKPRAGQDLAALERRNRREAKQAATTGQWSARYQAALRSPHWHDLRRRLLTRDARCATCGNGATQAIPLDLHHRTYRRLGTERDTDLQVLCRVCHDRLHDARGRQRTRAERHQAARKTWKAARQGDQSHRDRQLASMKAARKAKARRG